MWEIEGAEARWRSSQFAAKVNVQLPQWGLQEVRLGDQPLPAPAESQPGILQVHCGRAPSLDVETPSDCYIRGDDLIAVYRQTDERPVCPQIYWRYLGPSADALDAVGVELILSLQTSLLDGQADLEVLSCLAAEEVWCVDVLAEGQLRRCDEMTAGPGLLLVRPKDARVSFLQMTPDCDFAEFSSPPTAPISETLTVGFRLLAGPLEKGVIRRGRVRGMFVPRENDAARAVAAYREMLTAAPPLTA